MKDLKDTIAIERVELLARMICESLHASAEDKDAALFWIRDLLELLKKDQDEKED